ncbi:MAG: glucosaminidase domain-containing protein [Bacteroidota bacterium]|nr:glucosaminidase domain-containing protein [Bacteroidota bacterium]
MRVQKDYLFKSLLIASAISITACQKTEERKEFEEKQLNIEYRKIRSAREIQNSIDSIFVKPVIYDKMVPIADLDADQKKESFLQILLPAVLTVQWELRQKLERVKHIELQMMHKRPVNPEDSLYLIQLMNRYQAESVLDLKKRLKPHAASLVVAQAAVETGWGTSKLCLEANNFFGVISASPSNRKQTYRYYSEGKMLNMRKYSNILESIEHYFFILARAKSYHKFREQRWKGVRLEKLISGLTAYSERKKYYMNYLRGMIRQNELRQYDHFQIDSSSVLLASKPQKHWGSMGNIMLRTPQFNAFLAK